MAMMDTSSLGRMGVAGELPLLTQLISDFNIVTTTRYTLCPLTQPEWTIS